MCSNDQRLEPEYLAADGRWAPDARLLGYTLEADLGADEITVDAARSVARRLGTPGAVP